MCRAVNDVGKIDIFIDVHVEIETNRESDIMNTTVTCAVFEDEERNCDIADEARNAELSSYSTPTEQLSNISERLYYYSCIITSIFCIHFII